MTQKGTVPLAVPKSLKLMTKSNYKTITDKIFAQPKIFAQQGFITASYLNNKGRKYGPYFRLAYRDENHRQRSIYIGCCQDTANHIQALLDNLKAPLIRRRNVHVIHANLLSSLRRHKKQLQIELGKQGLYLRGFSVYGWRRLIGANKKTGPASFDS
jgi:hypothetical protein